jgi:two-component system OmpR family response regulator
MRILVVEDDEDLRRSVASCLTAESFAVDEAADGVEGLYLGRLNEYDLVVTDYALPKKDGLELCAGLREHGRAMPILVLSVKGSVPDKVALLDQGADDYLVKPFSYEELVARVRALLRRPQQLAAPVITVGDLTIDSARQVVRCGSREVYLTRKEFSLLEYLARHQGTVVSRSMLMEHVWNMDRDLFSNTIEAHILNLRKKLAARTRRKLIHTVSGRGYKVEP